MRRLSRVLPFLSAALPAAALALGLVCAPGARAAQPAAPFGLEWGMDVADLTAAGVPIHSTTRSGRLTVVNVKKVPEMLEGTYLVTLLFDRDEGLVKVRWLGQDIEDDPEGEAGRARYRELRAFVAERYGPPTDEATVTGARLFDRADEFYQCLKYEGCGVWSAIWELGAGAGAPAGAAEDAADDGEDSGEDTGAGDGDEEAGGGTKAALEDGPAPAGGGVLLSLQGLGPGTGFAQLDFESEAWQTAIEDYE